MSPFVVHILTYTYPPLRITAVPARWDSSSADTAVTAQLLGQLLQSIVNKIIDCTSIHHFKATDIIHIGAANWC